MAEATHKLDIWEDVWVHTTCGGCYGGCGIQVHRVNGVAIAIEGEPDSTLGAEGGMCGKGIAQLQLLYDPNRRNVPLRRTNPKKGLYEEGNFVEISWDEALDEIAKRIKEIRSDDPKKLLFGASPDPNSPLMMSLVVPWGMTICGNFIMGGGAAAWCGNGAHHVTSQYYASWDAGPDWKYCNYAIFFGASQGFGSGHAGGVNMRLAADARARGMKFVVFDPICNNTGAKATEWIPVIPGTDAAVALAMANVILNDLGIYDSPYIKHKTNGPYLIGPDGLYLRDKESGKPLVWDADAGLAKVFNDPSIKDYALSGNYEVDSVKCQPAFQMLKEHLKEYTPEMASKVSTVPGDTIRRIAKEYAEASQVGSTIVIDGVELPYRPVGVGIFRGGQGHTNSLHSCYAVHLLSQLVGAADVPGGTVGLGPGRVFSDPQTTFHGTEPDIDKDGMLLHTYQLRKNQETLVPPHVEPKIPVTHPGLRELFTQCITSPLSYSRDRKELWKKTGMELRYEMLINWGSNPVMSAGNRDTVEDWLKEIPFIVDIEILPTETSEGFADIILPDWCSLEHTTSCGAGDGRLFYFNGPLGSDDLSVHVMQPVIQPLFQRRSILDILPDLADRLGLRDKINSYMNARFFLDEKHEIQQDEKLTIEQMSDRVFKSNHGDDRGIEWFKENGFLRWKKKPEEAYWRWFVDVRVPIYLHDLVDSGPKIKELAESVDIHVNWEQYTGLISWFATPPHKASSEFDLYCLSYRDTLHTGSGTMEIPLLDEASSINPFTYNIAINDETARQKRLQDGDIICIESDGGRTIKGPIKTTQGIHPEVIAIAATAGHWVKGQPIAYGKGVNFDVLVELDLQHLSPVNLNMETSVKVKISKAQGE